MDVKKFQPLISNLQKSKIPYNQMFFLVLCMLLPIGDCSLLEDEIRPPTLSNAGSDKCTLCAGGMEPSRDPTEIIYGDTTCNDLQSQASAIGNKTNECFLLQLQGNGLCGCPATNVRKCTICAGQEQMKYPDNKIVLNGVTQTCRELDQSLPEHHESCPIIRTKGHFECGCESLPEIPTGFCSLCHDENAIYSDNIFEAAKRSNYYCSDAAVDIYATGAGSDECTRHQAEAFVYCGCNTSPPPPDDPSCTLCPGNILPDLLDKELSEYSGITCEQFHSLVPILYDYSTCYQLDDVRDFCRCPTQVSCRLCNNDENALDLEKVVVSETVDRTCGEIEEAANFIQLGASIGDFLESCQSYRKRFTMDCCPSSSIEPLDFGLPQLEGFSGASISLNPTRILELIGALSLVLFL